MLPMPRIVNLTNLLVAILIVPIFTRSAVARDQKPNVLILLADQWRAAATGYAGDPNVLTPNLDRLAAESANFVNAVSGCPVCCPYRASLMTGQRPLTHGVFLNDVQLPPAALTIADVLSRAGYDTGYIGKWHLDGRGRSNFTPPERRQGFKYWRALECSHDYNRSYYYADTPQKQMWQGYDAIAETRDAQQYIRRHADSGKPFFLVLAWGGPHNPYDTAPGQYRARYDPASLKLRDNVPAANQAAARKDLAGYYAHCTALDDCVGDIWAALVEAGIEDNTVVMFTADHGDMLYSHGMIRKQKPWEESLRVPMLMHFPRGIGRESRRLTATINSEDLMPTLLGLCGVPIPRTVEGLDFSGYVAGGENPSDGAALITCPSPFGEWARQAGGREFRGLRTERYTYVRDLNGPWLLFDDQADPYQLRNLCNATEYADLQRRLDAWLNRKLLDSGDRFLTGPEYVKLWGYEVNETGTVRYTP